MTDHGKTLTTAEFSQVTGIAVSTVSRMLRQGKLRGEKRDGKWAIYASELPETTTTATTLPADTRANQGPCADNQPHAATQTTYDIKTFSQMTYLTEKGVRQWLKTGRLSGGQDRVNASNLDRPEFQHLVRK